VTSAPERRHDVTVYTVDLDQPAAVVSRLDRMLPPDERDAPPGVRVARAAARFVLARQLETDPIDVAISRECAHCGHPAHGRPTVAGNEQVSFSVSHSGAYAVIALAADGARVGVDVEEIRPRSRIDALAARVLDDEEHALWSTVGDEQERLRSFLVVWTAKEAYLKALGIGITTRLRDVPGAVEGWTTRALDLGETRVGAIAADRSAFEIRYEALSPPAMSSDGIAR
jgi:phosphopantetheine--protein transferase-like protein